MEIEKLTIPEMYKLTLLERRDLIKETFYAIKAFEPHYFKGWYNDDWYIEVEITSHKSPLFGYDKYGVNYWYKDKHVCESECAGDTLEIAIISSIKQIKSIMLEQNNLNYGTNHLDRAICS